MKKTEADQVVKAIVDGVDVYAQLVDRSGVALSMLEAHREALDRAIQLMSGFYKYGHENMKPAGLPPPPNPYFNKALAIAEQKPEYYAFESVQRKGITRERAVWTCGQLGLDDVAVAETAIDNVCLPWRKENGWRTYVRVEDNDRHILQDKPPVKLKRHLDRLLEQLAD